MADATGERLAQTLSEQRLVSLALAEQIAEDHWQTMALPGPRAAHALFSHLLAWDEWAAAIFELEPPLPPKLIGAFRDVDGFNARAVDRLARIPRDDLLTALEWSGTRVLSAARGAGGDTWSERRIPDLAPAGAQPTSRGPRVSGVLTMLLEHEREHAAEVSYAYGITVDLDELRQKYKEADGEPNPADDGEDIEDIE